MSSKLLQQEQEDHRQREHEASQINEAMIATVADNKDPKKLGRVKLIIQALSDTDVTDWAPVVMFGAGKNRGWFFIPEVKDEVLVMFQHANLQHPIVIGSLWNGKDKPSGKNPGGVPTRHIKSRAGSMIVFDDENGKIEISDGGKKGKITFDAAANKITIESLDGDVCFQAPKGLIHINAKSIELTTKSGNIESVSGTNMTIGCDTSMNIKAGSDITWSGSSHKKNSQAASAPAKKTATPKEVKHPYGS